MEPHDHVPPPCPAGNEGGVLHQLERYRGLGQQCRHWETLLENAESHRHSVRASIFERVRKEYEEKKAVLEIERREWEDVLRENLQQCLGDRQSIQEETGNGLERLEEMDFRIRVGEVREKELAGEMSAVRQHLDERARDLERTEGILRLYAEVGLLAEASPPRTRQEDGVHGFVPDADGEHGFFPGAPGGAPAARTDGQPVTLEPPAPENEPDGLLPEPAAAKKEPDQHSLHGYVTGYLVATAGSRKGERFPLISSNVTLGNSPWIDIRLNDPEVNHLHARILYKERKHFLENLDPMARSLVNGIQADIVELRDGDIIQLGKVGFRVEYDAVPRVWNDRGSTGAGLDHPRLSD